MSAYSPLLIAPLVALAGGAGAWGRFRLEIALRAITRRLGIEADLEADAPVIKHLGGIWPILAINVIGCFLAGLLASGLLAHPLWGPVIGGGLLGGFTTFSTAMMDAYAIALRPQSHPRKTRLLATALAALITLIACVLACIIGIALARAFL